MSAEELSKENSRKEKIRQYQKEYKQAHKEQHRLYMNDYVAKAPQILCACGGRYKQYSGYKHNQTKKHLKFVEEAFNTSLPEKEEVAIVEMDIDKLEVKDLEEPKVKLEMKSLFIELTGEEEEKSKPVKIKKTVKRIKKPTIEKPKDELNYII